MIRTHSRFVIVGAGIHGPVHGLASGPGTTGPADWAGARTSSCLDKARTRRGGASGIACGTVRNNYFQPAMRELMAHSVSVWESDPEAFSYHRVGFLQIAPGGDVRRRGADFSLRAAGPSATRPCSSRGRTTVSAILLDMFEDWQARGSTTVLHEKKGGYANNIRAVRGLAAKAEAEGVCGSRAGVPRHRVRGSPGTRWTSVETDQGNRRRAIQLVIAVGPVDPRPVGPGWIYPKTITVAEPGGTGGAGAADVDLLGTAGGHAGGRAGRVHR